MLVEILHVLEPLQSEGEVPVVEYRGEGELEGRWAACPDYLTKHITFGMVPVTYQLRTTIRSLKPSFHEAATDNMGEHQRPYVPAKTLSTEYPLIDSDPHFKRVVKYARPSDYAAGAVSTIAGPGLLLLWERIAPSHVGKGGFAPILRLTTAVSAGAGFLLFYNRSILRFYGFEENKREVEMDMREMVEKVKRKEPLYGTSSLSPYLQGVASRNSRYSGVWLHVIPWFNFVNHEQHGVDTAKYYRQAERELAAEQASQSSIS